MAAQPSELSTSFQNAVEETEDVPEQAQDGGAFEEVRSYKRSIRLSSKTQIGSGNVPTTWTGTYQVPKRPNRDEHWGNAFVFIFFDKIRALVYLGLALWFVITYHVGMNLTLDIGPLFDGQDWPAPGSVALAVLSFVAQYGFLLFVLLQVREILRGRPSASLLYRFAEKIYKAWHSGEDVPFYPSPMGTEMYQKILYAIMGIIRGIIVNLIMWGELNERGTNALYQVTFSIHEAFGCYWWLALGSCPAKMGYIMLAFAGAIPMPKQSNVGIQVQSFAASPLGPSFEFRHGRWVIPRSHYTEHGFLGPFALGPLVAMAKEGAKDIFPPPVMMAIFPLLGMLLTWQVNWKFLWVYWLTSNMISCAFFLPVIFVAMARLKTMIKRGDLDEPEKKGIGDVVEQEVNENSDDEEIVSI